MKHLQSCDILLFKVIPASTLSEKFIAWAQHLVSNVPLTVKYCHVALVDSDTDLMLEAKWPKIKLTKIDFNKIYKHEAVEIYRVRNITNEQKIAVLTWAHDSIDEWYDILLFFTGWLSMKHSEICSTYVSHAFKAAGLKIPYKSSNRAFVIPDDFYNDNAVLERIF